MKMAGQILLPVLLLGMISTVSPQSAGPLYPIEGTETPREDDGSSPLIQLQHSFPYFGQSYNQIYVNNNGHLTFTASFYSYTPQQFPMHGTIDIIAPFWTDMDNRVNGHVYYNQYTSGSVLQQATRDIKTYFPGLGFRADLVFVATWHEVPYFADADARTTFQVVLISGGSYSFVLMNYGAIAATTRNVQAGYDTINSAYHYSIPGSFTTTATGPSSLFHLGSNVNVPGRWAFRTALGRKGCEHSGNLLQLGISFWTDSTCSEKCTCTSAGLKCDERPCPGPLVCREAAFLYACQKG